MSAGSGSWSSQRGQRLADIPNMVEFTAGQSDLSQRRPGRFNHKPQIVISTYGQGQKSRLNASS
jgi:hypothetical protein